MTMKLQSILQSFIVWYLISLQLLLSSEFGSCFVVIVVHNEHGISQQSRTVTVTTLFERQARRNLPKRRRRTGKDDELITTSTTQTTPSSVATKQQQQQQKQNQQQRQTIEIVPMISSVRKEAGVDYWIDPTELEKQKLRESAIRPPDPGQIPDDKLWAEVLSPYKQNWIGIISVTLVALAFIFKNFPEVINPPIISNIPDLI